VTWLDQIKNRKVAYGAGSIVSVLLVAGILVVAALLADWHQVRWDLTRGKTQSLSPVTRNLLKQLDQHLTLTDFRSEGTGEREADKELLQRYAYASPLVSFNFVDPEREPQKAKEAGFRFSGNVLLEYAGRHQLADRVDEDSITNALRRILKPRSKKVYFLTGHGERDVASGAEGGLQTAKRALENEGYEVNSLSLIAQSQIPEDAAAVMVASPDKPLLASEVDALKGYLNRGGRLLVMLEAYQDGGLKGFLAGYGIALDDGVILDVNTISQSLRLSPIMPIALDYGPTRITRDFQNKLTIYPMSRPLSLSRGTKGVILQPLVKSMPSSYEKLGKEWLKGGNGNFDSRTDKKGPFTIGALAEIEPAPGKPENPGPPGGKSPGGNKQAYLAVYGDVDYISNAYFNLLFNGDLFLNTVNFLAQEEHQIMVRQATKAQLLVLSGNQIVVMFLVSLVLAPLAMLAAGIRAYVVRRGRK
jgi:ABC-type uncharacterized transport system involved in gliding motility auxiliary subunit